MESTRTFARHAELIGREGPQTKTCSQIAQLEVVGDAKLNLFHIQRPLIVDWSQTLQRSVCTL